MNILKKQNIEMDLSGEELHKIGKDELEFISSKIVSKVIVNSLEIISKSSDDPLKSDLQEKSTSSNGINIQYFKN